jgi:hypothetical protein
MPERAARQPGDAVYIVRATAPFAWLSAENFQPGSAGLQLRGASGASLRRSRHDVMVKCRPNVASGNSHGNVGITLFPLTIDTQLEFDILSS